MKVTFLARETARVVEKSLDKHQQRYLDSRRKGKLLIGKGYLVDKFK